MQTNEEFEKEFKKLIANGRSVLAHWKRRNRNYEIMNPPKEYRVFVGTDEYFLDEGAVSGSVDSRSLILRGKDE